jgi:hypothetical protein
MKFKKFLDEEYVGYTSGEEVGSFSGGYTEIFKNPTPKEMIDAANASKSFRGLVRFIADLKHRNIFVFKGDTFHNDVSMFLETEGEYSDEYTAVWGTGTIKNGKIKYEGSDTFGYKILIEYIKMGINFDWTKKYFGRSLLDILKEFYSEQNRYFRGY